MEKRDFKLFNMKLWFENKGMSTTHSHTTLKKCQWKNCFMSTGRIWLNKNNLLQHSITTICIELANELPDIYQFQKNRQNRSIVD